MPHQSQMILTVGRMGHAGEDILLFAANALCPTAPAACMGTAAEHHLLAEPDGAPAVVVVASVELLCNTGVVEHGVDQRRQLRRPIGLRMPQVMSFSSEYFSTAHER